MVRRRTKRRNTIRKNKNYNKKKNYSKKKYSKKKKFSKKRKKSKRVSKLQRGGSLSQWAILYTKFYEKDISRENMLVEIVESAYFLYSRFLSEGPSTVICLGQSPAFTCLCMKNFKIYDPNNVNIVVIPLSRPRLACTRCGAIYQAFQRDDSIRGITCYNCNAINPEFASTDEMLHAYAEKIRENFQLWTNIKKFSHSAAGAMSKISSFVSDFRQGGATSEDAGDMVLAPAPEDSFSISPPDEYQNIIKNKVIIIDTLSYGENNSIKKAQKLFELTFPGQLNIELYGLCPEYLVNSISPCYAVNADITASKLDYIDYLSTESPRIVDSYPLDNVLDARKPLPFFDFKIHAEGWKEDGQEYDIQMIKEIVSISKDIGVSKHPVQSSASLLSYKTENNVSYDFDGVFHKLVDNKSKFSRDSLISELCSYSAIKSYLNLSSSIFPETFEDMHHFQSNGKNIFVISSNLLPTGQLTAVQPDNTVRLILLMNGIVITNDNIMMNVLKKYSVVARLNIERHVDDSINHLIKISESNPSCECVLALPESREYHQLKPETLEELKESCKADRCPDEIITNCFNIIDGRVFADYFQEYFLSLGIEESDIEVLRSLFASLGNFHTQMVFPILEMYYTASGDREHHAKFNIVEFERHYIIDPFHLLMETWLQCEPSLKKKIILYILGIGKDSPAILSGWLRFINEEEFINAQKNLLINLLQRDINYYHLLSDKLKLYPEIYSNLGGYYSSSKALTVILNPIYGNLPTSGIEFWVSENGFPMDFKFPKTQEHKKCLDTYIYYIDKGISYVSIFNPMFLINEAVRIKKEYEGEYLVEIISMCEEIMKTFPSQLEKMNEIINIVFPESGIVITDDNRDEFFTLIKKQGIMPDIYERLSKINIISKKARYPEVERTIDPLLDEIYESLQLTSSQAGSKVTQDAGPEPEKVTESDE